MFAFPSGDFTLVKRSLFRISETIKYQALSGGARMSPAAGPQVIDFSTPMAA